MRNLNETYKDLFSGKHKDFAEKNNKSMNATNIELWFSSRYIFYVFAIIGNIASFIGCAYGIHLYLSDSMPALLSWMIGVIFSAGLEITFVYAYQFAAIKIFQKRLKYALPYLFIACFYVLVYFPTTYGFESFVIRTDEKVNNLNVNYSKDSLHTAKIHDTKIDSLNNRILFIENERLTMKYYTDFVSSNKLKLSINEEKNRIESQKEKALFLLSDKFDEHVTETEAGLLQTSQRHLNLAIIILLYVFIMYTAISIIRYFADEEYRQFHQILSNGKMIGGIEEKKKSLATKTNPMKVIKKPSMN